MGSLYDKKQMTEEDIKLKFITPAIVSKWNINKISMEARITDGKMNLKGNFTFREKPKKADYLLYLKENYPIAVVEAKDNKHSVSYGPRLPATILPQGRLTGMPPLRMFARYLWRSR